MLRLRGVSKLLGGRAVIDGVDLDCAAGEVSVIVGANGCGKSTLLRVVAGILTAETGEIRIGGYSLERHPSKAKSQLGYMPDGLEVLSDLRASELVALVRGLRGLPREADAVELGWRERLGFEQFAGQRLQSLSLGQRRRVGLIAALAGWPPLLLLDEPSSGLDPAGVQLLLELVETRRATGCSHLVTTNDMELARALRGTRHELVQGRLAVRRQRG